MTSVSSRSPQEVVQVARAPLTDPKARSGIGQGNAARGPVPSAIPMAEQNRRGAIVRPGGAPAALRASRP
ncbi:hypothetical protein GQF56_16765 [Rhodobacter sphaeroides]|jgi:hypothetical protein|uniref:Uncharacterized protein n=1 Tax=Cereibacter sphaeroides (strain ATCC 17023 / DSM 158 / JCM 6121 / CCUG 31486 / LMG 2827 / NBRC 12203 / NCIMB 8253 / ATH 2.4.1.) TaxID=272943 RepID=U5NRM8_CERS4|nr:hypothetical protein RSP_7605 [Cereibacter sphaeroides 2.4.1]AXC63408.1 hypothetical protein DQL45_18645 [Cereibacter sphaeroides 2.4.1]MVX49505.1 hypothetical protein [Cereibacter sphaeroides]QHA15014.1 hypothetical protein GQY06_18595 [Cereibacter sphaeroides]GEM92267.1 hypothetical protein RSP03_13340 [Cereibacter sphaeroides]